MAALRYVFDVTAATFQTEVAERSALPRDRWTVVPPDWGPKGPTAQVPGDISSLDPVFAAADRGVPLRVL